MTEARAQVNKVAVGGTVEQKAAAEQALDKSLVNVMAVAEQYPDLKASANFLQLQGQATDTENQLAFARPVLQRRGCHPNTLIVTPRGCCSTGWRRSASVTSTKLLRAKPRPRRSPSTNLVESSSFGR